MQKKEFRAALLTSQSTLNKESKSAFKVARRGEEKRAAGPLFLQECNNQLLRLLKKRKKKGTYFHDTLKHSINTVWFIIPVCVKLFPSLTLNCFQSAVNGANNTWVNFWYLSDWTNKYQRCKYRCAWDTWDQNISLCKILQGEDAFIKPGEDRFSLFFKYLKLQCLVKIRCFLGKCLWNVIMNKKGEKNVILKNVVKIVFLKSAIVTLTFLIILTKKRITMFAKM